MRNDTKCVQSGYDPKNGEARVLPIYQSTTFKYDSTDHVGDLFDLKSDGFFYTRLANPTLACVEEKIADLEGGVGAMLTSSGQSANMIAILNIAKAGDHIVSTSTIYGGTYNLFNVTIRKMGIDFTFIDPDSDEEAIQNAIKENTKAVFAETIANPALNVIDIEKFVKVAHKNKIPFIIDNTFATPINCRPIEWGADIVTHSTSKYMDGHAVSLGGCIVDSGNFDWKNSGKFPEFTNPDDSYHGLVYVDAYKEKAFIVKARVQMLRDMGSTPSPFNAFLLNLGLETLHLRMKKHCENALEVAKFLKNHKKIEWVSYPSLEGDKNYDVTKKYMPNGSCGVISLAIKGTREDAVKFMDSLKLASIVVHVADARTGVLHPASSTHRQLSDEELIKCKIAPNQVRLSVGIEDVKDIIEDLDNALNSI